MGRENIRLVLLLAFGESCCSNCPRVLLLFATLESCSRHVAILSSDFPTARGLLQLFQLSVIPLSSQVCSNIWEERFYTQPPGCDFQDCVCTGIETEASICHPLWVVVYRIALPNSNPKIYSDCSQFSRGCPNVWVKRVFEYGVRAPAFYGNLRQQTVENGFPRIPTGMLFVYINL